MLHKRTNYAGIVLVVIIIAALVVGGIFVYQKFFNKEDPVHAETLDIEGVISEIGELATAEYCFKAPEVVEREKTQLWGLAIPGTGNKIIFCYEGVVKAGIEFSDVKATVNENNKTVFIRLPEAKILSTELNNDSFEIYDEEKGIFSRNFDFTDFNNAQQDLKDNVKQSAIESGLLERASENAKTLIKSAVGALLDLNEYSIEFY